MVAVLKTRFGAGVARKATREQQSWAIFKRARNEYCIACDDPEGNAVPDNATADYLLACQLSPKSDWADTALTAGRKHSLEFSLGTRMGAIASTEN